MILNKISEADAITRNMVIELNKQYPEVKTDALEMYSVELSGYGLKELKRNINFYKGERKVSHNTIEILDNIGKVVKSIFEDRVIDIDKILSIEEDKVLVKVAKDYTTKSLRFQSLVTVIKHEKIVFSDLVTDKETKIMFNNVGDLEREDELETILYGLGMGDLSDVIRSINNDLGLEGLINKLIIKIAEFNIRKVKPGEEPGTHDSSERIDRFLSNNKEDILKIVKVILFSVTKNKG